MNARSRSVRTAGRFCALQARLTAALGATLAHGFLKRLSDCSWWCSEFGLGIASICDWPNSLRRELGTRAENREREEQIAYNMLSFCYQNDPSSKNVETRRKSEPPLLLRVVDQSAEGRGPSAVVASWAKGGSISDFQKSAMINEAVRSAKDHPRCSDAPPALLVENAPLRTRT